ncbi:MAG: pilus assembly protein [Pseudomonadota bacterium]|nr:pilus assembly protein [Pseudomonadota bacterium]
MPARRGGAAIEFAIVLPLFTTFVYAILEYGWFFWRQSLIIIALNQALRAGSFEAPDTETEESSECGACQTVAAAAAVASLERIGLAVDPDEVTPAIEAIDSTCALVFQTSLPHTSLIGLVPVPSAYDIRLVAYAQNLIGC